MSEGPMRLPSLRPFDPLTPWWDLDPTANDEWRHAQAARERRLCQGREKMRECQEAFERRTALRKAAAVAAASPAKGLNLTRVAARARVPRPKTPTWDEPVPVPTAPHATSPRTLRTSKTLPKLPACGRSSGAGSGGDDGTGTAATAKASVPRSSASLPVIVRFAEHESVLCSSCARREMGKPGRGRRSRAVPRSNDNMTRRSRVGAIQLGGGGSSSGGSLGSGFGGADSNSRSLRPRDTLGASIEGTRSRKGEPGSWRRVGGRHAVGHSPSVLLGASQNLLHEMALAPEDEVLRAGFGDAINAFKLADAPTRWMQWPWQPAPRAAAQLKETGCPPPQLEAPYAATVSEHRLEFCWSGRPLAVPATTSAGESDSNNEAMDAVGATGSAAVRVSAMSGVAVGYEVEASEVNALSGASAFKSVHRRRVANETIGGTAELALRGRGVVAVRVRVRGYNKFGKGEWSEVTTLSRPEPVAEEKIEVRVVPSAWLQVDLGGLPALKDDEVGSGGRLQTKELLLQSLLRNQKTIKIAFTFYALAGVADVWTPVLKPIAACAQHPRARARVCVPRCLLPPISLL